MDTNENNASREANGRFMPGQSGNPALSEASLRLTLTAVSSKPREAGNAPAPLEGPSKNAQEGRGEGAAPTNILHRDEPPPPIACAMGPFLSRPFDKSSGGRGEDERFRARLLHSTCISPSPAATWRAGLAA